MDVFKGDLAKKLEILAAGAKYDVSCSSSGSQRGAKGGLGNTAACGICHSWTSDGRCVSLLKILLTNACMYDCAYCVNRRTNDLPRATLTPDEVAELTIGFYRRNYIEGLFLSTGVVRNPDYTMELVIESVRKLREDHRFNGYIHLKVVPGADPILVEKAGRLADRLSINIEVPTRKSLALLAPDKSREAILLPMRQVSDLIMSTKEERKVSRKVPRFAPAGQSTQLMVGASTDTDLHIVRLSEGLYRRMGLKRVYYSAFVPVTGDVRLPALPGPPLLREHRLYQADWLMRYYGFASDEILDESAPHLDLDIDPKAAWALRHFHLFPVEVNQADYEVLLRVPGIGVRSAQKIVRARRVGHLSLEDLKKLGVVLKRAVFFITAKGKFLGGSRLKSEGVKLKLLEPQVRKQASPQLSLFDNSSINASDVSGEI